MRVGTRLCCCSVSVAPALNLGCICMGERRLPSQLDVDGFAPMSSGLG